MRISQNLRPLISVAALATGACAAPPGVSEDEELATVEIDLYAAHIHSLETSKVTIRGEVPEARGFVEMTATLDGGTVARMTVATQAGRRFVVPQSVFSGIDGVRANSFQIANGVTSRPRSVAGVVIWIEYGRPEARKDLGCDETHLTDPSYRTLELSVNATSGEFTRRLKDACGREQS